MAISKPPLSLPGYMSDSVVWGNSAFTDDLEHVADLIWPESIRTYGRMRQDPQLAAVFASIVLPIRSADWTVDPSGCRDEVVQLISDDLGIPILGTDEEPGPARRRGVLWKEHLRIACLNFLFGHLPFAQKYELKGGKYRLVELAERLPSTITSIDSDEEGKLKSILQFGAKKEIPARHLVWYVHDREGAAHQGRSIFRPAFGPWILKHETLRVHATSIRRFGMGIPAVKAPPGGTPAQVTEAQNLAVALRAGDQSGVGLPSGFNFELIGMTGTAPDALGFIKYLDMAMAKMVLAQAMELGSTETGARALGESFSEQFLMSLNSLASEMATVATGLSVQMVDYNWGENEPAPRIVCSDVRSKPSLTAESLSQLIQVGAIVPDKPLLDYVREWYQLPEIDEESSVLPSEEVTAPEPTAENLTPP